MKLRNKLILSCAALAAVATTAVSTTFAWYTSNDEVTASNISGASANSGSELLLISADASKWGTSIADVIENPNTELTPLAFVENTKESTDQTNNVLVGMNTVSKKVVTAEAAADASGYLGFTVYLKNASTTAKALNMNIVSLTNTTSSLPSKPVIGNGAQYIGLASSAAEYTVNALRVLAMDLEVYRTENNGTDFTFLSEAAYNFENITSTDIFDVTKVNGSTAKDSLDSKTAGAITPAVDAYDAGTVLAINTDLTNYYTRSGDAEPYTYSPATGKADGTSKYYKKTSSVDTYEVGSKFNAHQYYNSIMGPDSVIDNTSADPTVFGTLSTAGKITALVSKDNFKTAGTSTTAGTYLKVVGKLFLNGWDLACFDACQGQSFNLNISFDVRES